MKKLSLKEIQYEEKEILKILIDFLEKNNINYYIWAGTLLGAVRHKGFIPWDDDIDILILRNEYEKLIKILKDGKTNLSNNIGFEGFEIGKGDYPFLKVFNYDIKVKDKWQWDKGLWIDIFPLDGIPENYRFYYIKRKIIKRLICPYRAKNNSYPNYREARGIKKVLYKLINIKHYNRILQKYIHFCSKYRIEDSKYVCDNIWCGNGQYYLEKDKILETSIYDFEDLKVKGFKNYDYVLSAFYGDYMKLPPKGERTTHNFEAYR